MLNSNKYTYTSSQVFVVLVCSFIYTLTEGCVLCCVINVTSHLMSTFRFTGFFCRHFHSMNRKTTVSEAPHTAKQSSDSMLCCMIITPDQWVKSNREALWSLLLKMNHREDVFFLHLLQDYLTYLHSAFDMWLANNNNNPRDLTISRDMQVQNSVAHTNPISCQPFKFGNIQIKYVLCYV